MKIHIFKLAIKNAFAFTIIFAFVLTICQNQHLNITNSAVVINFAFTLFLEYIILKICDRKLDELKNGKDTNNIH